MNESHVRARHEALWELMREYKVRRVVVKFDGSDDLGEITEVDAEFDGYDPRGAHDTPDDRRDSIERRRAFMERRAPAGAHGEEQSVEQLAKDLTAAIICAASFPDWCGNDGGFGEVVFMPDDPPRMDVECNVRIIRHETTCYEYNQYGMEVEGNEGDTDLAARHGAEQEALTGKERP